MQSILQTHLNAVLRMACKICPDIIVPLDITHIPIAAGAATPVATAVTSAATPVATAVTSAATPVATAVSGTPGSPPIVSKHLNVSCLSSPGDD